MKPMLSGTLEEKHFELLEKKIKESGFLYASPKIDGVRAIIKDGQFISRSLKRIPNNNIQNQLKHLIQRYRKRNFELLDGELVIFDEDSNLIFNRTISIVMAHEAAIKGLKLRFCVFDRVDPKEPFYQRFRDYGNIVDEMRIFKKVPQYKITDIDSMLKLSDHFLSKGYEGLMLRDPHSLYKYGRSTVKEGYLLKFKKFTDSEAEIIDFVESMQNNNIAVINELGYLERSTKKENKFGKDTLGSLRVRDINTNLEFNIGTGLTDSLRKEIWDNRHNYLGKLVKYKYMENGMVDLPRHPVFLGFRHEDDM